MATSPLHNLIENEDELVKRLSPFRINLSELTPHLKIDDDGAMLLLAGSFNEQLATPTSDIDLMLVYPAACYVAGLSKSREPQSREVRPLRDGDASFFADNILVINRQLSGGQKIQTTVTTEKHIRGLQISIAERNDGYRRRIQGDKSALQRRGRLIAGEPQWTLHRFYSGLPLKGSRPIAELREKLPLQELCDNVGVRGTSGIQIIALDLRGLLVQTPEDLESIVLIHNQLLVNLASVLLASVGEISPNEKLRYQLLRRYEARIGGTIVRDILQRFLDVVELARRDPLGIVTFVSDVLDRATVLSPLVRAEYAEWNSETRYPLFEQFRDSTGERARVATV